MNLPFNRTDFIVHRSAWNRVEFQLWDNDRKPMKTRGRLFTFNAINPANNQYVLRKTLEVVSYDRGILCLVLNPSETAPWPAGPVRYSVSVETDMEDGEYVAYTDQQFAAHGWLLVDQHALALPPVAEAIRMEDFVPTGLMLDTTTIYTTGPYKSALSRSSANNLHTVAVYATKYTGKFFIQATLDEHPSADRNWFDVEMSCDPYWNFCCFSGIEAFNFRVNARWLRFRHQPNPMFFFDHIGSVDQVLLNV